MGNVFALLGLRALFVLVEGLIERFRYLDQTIAVVLGVVGIKLLIEDLVKIGPVASLLIIAVLFTIGIVASIIADRRDPDAARKREQRSHRTDASEDDEQDGSGGEDEEGEDGADAGNGGARRADRTASGAGTSSPSDA
jgi:tellurite resistance protein TerC